MKNEESSPQPSADGPVPGQEALDLLQEVDTYVHKLKHEHQRDDGLDHATAHRGSDQVRIDQTEAWVHEHTTALEVRRQQLDEQAAAQEIQQAELQNMRIRLVREGQKLKEQWKLLAAQKQSLDRKQAQSSNDRAAQRMLEGGSIPGDDADLQQQRQQIKSQRHQIQRAWATLKKEKAAIVRQQRRLTLKEQSLADTDASSGVGPSVDGRRLENYRQQLQEQFKQLRTGEAVVNLARQQYAELLEQRQVLVEVKRYLQATEQQMIRRWSVHRGVGMVGGLGSCMLFLLLFSFGVGHRIVHPVWRAKTEVGLTATVFDESRYGMAWMTQQHQLLVDDDLLREAIRLGAQRGVRIFSNTGTMREALSRGLSVELVAPGRIALTFCHTDKDLVVDVLKSVGRALVNHHTMEDRVSGRPNSMRIHQEAARDPQPIHDGRMVASLVTLLGSTVVVVVLAVFVRWSLLGSVRVFEQTAIPELDQLEDPDRWPQEPSLAEDAEHPAQDRAMLVDSETKP